MQFSHTWPRGIALVSTFALLMLTLTAPSAVAASGPGGGGGGGGGGTPSGGTPGPCVSAIVPSSLFLFNTGGDVTLKATVANCSSDTTAPQLVVIFRTIGGGDWCVYPESGGNPASFTLDPGHTKSLSCTAPSTRNGSSSGLPAVAEVYANCASFSTQSGIAVRNLDGTPFRDPSQNFTNSTCTLVATSNTYTVMPNR